MSNQLLQQKEPYVFKRFCKRCGKMFRPNGKYNIYCIYCLEKSGSPAHIRALKKQVLVEIEDRIKKPKKSS